VWHLSLLTLERFYLILIVAFEFANKWSIYLIQCHSCVVNSMRIMRIKWGLNSHSTTNFLGAWDEIISSSFMGAANTCVVCMHHKILFRSLVFTYAYSQRFWTMLCFFSFFKCGVSELQKTGEKTVPKPKICQNVLKFSPKKCFYKTGQFPLLQKQQKQRTVGFEYFFKTLKEPSVFNKQLWFFLGGFPSSWTFQVSADLVLRVGITKIFLAGSVPGVWGFRKMGTAGYTPR